MTAFTKMDLHMFYSSDPLPSESTVRGYCTCQDWLAEEPFEHGKMLGVPGGVSEHSDEERARRQLRREHDIHVREARRRK